MMLDIAFLFISISFTVDTDIERRYHKLISHCESIAVLIFGADRLRQKVEAAHCGDSEAQIQKPAGPIFTSSFFLTLSNNLSLGKLEEKLKKKPEFSPHR